MSITRKNQAPVGITNTTGEPEIVLEIDGLVLSMKPPASAADVRDDLEAEAAGDLDDE
ncbi:MAG: hypothetical protein HY828_01275 [Actinobacteria bacterium]|nr:hypothetical protein [Actinomycetota bacterium]